MSEMSLNVNLLSRLVTWAAENNLRHTNPDKAVELGLVKANDPRIGKWKQDEWGTAERNGVCNTAFCLAGEAASMDENVLIVMEPSLKLDDFTKYGASYVIEKSALPATLPKGVEEQFGHLWLDGEEYESAYDLADDIGIGLDRTGKWSHIEEYARKALVGEGSVYGLFSGSNDITTVVSLAAAIAEGYDETLNVPVWVMDYNTATESEDFVFEHVTDEIRMLRQQSAA